MKKFIINLLETPRLVIVTFVVFFIVSIILYFGFDFPQSYDMSIYKTIRFFAFIYCISAVLSVYSLNYLVSKIKPKKKDRITI